VHATAWFSTHGVIQLACPTACSDLINQLAWVCRWQACNVLYTRWWFTPLIEVVNFTDQKEKAKDCYSRQTHPLGPLHHACACHTLSSPYPSPNSRQHHSHPLVTPFACQNLSIKIIIISSIILYSVVPICGTIYIPDIALLVLRPPFHLSVGLRSKGYLTF